MSDADDNGVPGVGPQAGRSLAFGPFRFYPDTELLYLHDDEVALPPRALEVLECLLDRPGRVVSKRELMERVWGGTTVTDHSLTEAVRTVRVALGDNSQEPRYIKTVFRRGYRFIAPVSPHAIGLPGVGNALDALEPAGRWPLRWRSLAFAAAGLAVVLSVLFSWRAGISVDGRVSAPRIVPFIVAPPADTEILMGEMPRILMLPDGSGVVFAAGGARSATWYVQSFDTVAARPLPRSENVAYAGPWFAMDPGRLGFFAGTDIMTMSTRDGSTDTLCTACTGRVGERGNAGATWSPDGTIVFANGELRRLLPTGEFEVIPAPRLDHPRGAYMWPSFLPGYQWVLATARTTGTIRGAGIVAVHVESGETKPLIEDGTNPQYVSATGHLLFARNGDLMAVPFDLQRLEVRGSPVVVVEGVMMSAVLGGAQYSVSDNGTLVYQPGEIIRREFPILSSDLEGGDVHPLIEERRDFRELRFSPDGSRVAVTVGDGPYRKIWVYDLESGRRIVGNGQTDSTGGDEGEPAWDPRGTRLAFVSLEKDTYTLKVVRADGTVFANDDTDIVSSTDYIALPSWSADGRTIAYQTWKNQGWDIWVVDVADPAPQPFLESKQDEMVPEFSPDGRWLAYSSDGQIYVTDHPGREQTLRVSNDDSWGNDIRWAAGGRALYYKGPGLWVASAEPGPEHEFGTPRRLPVRGFMMFLDISADGQEIIRVDRRRSPVMSSGFNVVLDWFTELERLVPTAR